jgi:hypothetical protein
MSQDAELSTPQPLSEVHGVSRERFEGEIRPLGRPVVLRDVVADWHLVRLGQASGDALADHLARQDPGRTTEVLFGPQEIEGRFFYSDDMRGLNFHRRTVPVGAAIKGILAQSKAGSSGTVYLQSLPVVQNLPGLEVQNPMPLLDPTVEPRIWVGNRLTVQTHFDLQENIACCVAGRRRFTLFPPEQTPNLYPGPFEFTLSGPPVSMVRLNAPDLQAYPRFREAARHALVAELDPGDAVYIPYGWWHQVESLETFNVLMNYWWNPASAMGLSPFDTLLHAILSLRDLPLQQVGVWKVLFDTYVFRQHGDPAAHLPEHARGAHGEHTDAMRRELLSQLARKLGQVRPG